MLTNARIVRFPCRFFIFTIATSGLRSHRFRLVRGNTTVMVLPSNQADLVVLARVLLRTPVVWSHRPQKSINASGLEPYYERER